MPFTIYCLYDLRTRELRYIGKTKQDLKARLSHHLCQSKSPANYNQCWIKSTGFQVGIELLDAAATAEELNDLEVMWIAYFKAMGARLTNLTQGGDGGVGYSPSLETRRKMGISHLGNRSRTGMHNSEEWRKKVSKALKGRKRGPMTAGAKEAISAAAKLRTGAKNSFYGRKHSDETRQRISIARHALHLRNLVRHEIIELFGGGV